MYWICLENVNLYCFTCVAGVRESGGEAECISGGIFNVCKRVCLKKESKIEK